MNQIVLVLGATSAIALAYCRRLAARGSSFVLVGRRADRLETVAADLKAWGAPSTAAVVSDLTDMHSCEDRFVEFCGPLGRPDQVLLAYGTLGQPNAAEQEIDEIRRIIDVNFTSAALWLQAAAKHLVGGRDCSFIVISSVAGDRGRRSNYAYGSAKAGLSAFAEGLAHRLHGTNLHVLTVKPGFVDTPMTAHLERGGLLWATPERVAVDIDRAVSRKRSVAYTPGFWRPIMAVVRAIPRPLFFRTKL